MKTVKNLRSLICAVDLPNLKFGEEGAIQHVTSNYFQAFFLRMQSLFRMYVFNKYY